MTRVLDRWCIRGTLTTTGELRIGTGRYETEFGLADTTSEDGSILAIETDHLDRPLIPGASLKGALRARLLYAIGDRAKEALERLLGHGIKDNDRDFSLAGAVEFRDATFVGTADTTREARQTSIDGATKTARKASLRRARVVKPGSVFQVELVADGVGQQDMALLLAGMRLLDGGVGSSLGGGKGVGRGACRWELAAVDHLSPAAILRWMEAQSEGTTSASWRPSALSPQSQLTLEPSLAEQIEAVSRFFRAPEDFLDVRLHLAIDGPFLIGSGNRETSGEAQRLASLKDDQQKHRLTGSALRGAIRAQAERIWRTVHGGAPETRSTEPCSSFEWLFGKATWAGALEIGEPTWVKEREQVQQEFVAIDRFTGGSAGGAKFALNPAIDAEYSATVRLRLDDVEHALSALGLLALLYRDLIEGDITVGHSASKGYGRLKVSDAKIASFDESRLQAVFGKPVPRPADWRADNAAFRELVYAAVAAFRTATHSEKAA